MREALQRAWERRGALARLLWPVSLLFAALTALRRALYRVALLKRETLPVPVVVVGNVVVGGCGKTPVVMALVRHLRERGWHPGVVSRGYGRHRRDVRLVAAGASARDVGDEPLLIARACAVPVAVAPRRARAARVLLARHPKTDLLVCDDGLQHEALRRDVEICVFDERGLGNGWRLPAGPLREGWPRPGAPAALVLHAGLRPAFAGFTARRALAAEAVRADGSRVALATLRDQPLLALAGIARPEAFFHMLRAQGLDLAHTLALPDHYDFASWKRPPDVDFPLICTEKDAVKLWLCEPDALAVPLRVEPEPAFFEALDARLARWRLSSAGGG